MHTRANVSATRTTVRLPQHVVYRAFDSETVVLNLVTGNYHGLNPTGGRMLDALASTACVEDAAAAVAGEFRVPLEQVRPDIDRFCQELVQRGLLEVD